MEPEFNHMQCVLGGKAAMASSPRHSPSGSVEVSGTTPPFPHTMSWREEGYHYAFVRNKHGREDGLWWGICQWKASCRT